jgi:LysR family transcriptional regulator, hydrogen peroxide-inducible genes activator
MNIADLTLREIDYMLALAAYGHFGRAAEACHVSQPALSKQIAALEHKLGLSLFERTPKGVRVKPEAEPLLLQAQRLWHEAVQLNTLLPQPHNPLTYPWKLGIIASACPYVLPVVLPTLLGHYPHTQLHEGLTYDLLAALDAGQLDAVWMADTIPSRAHAPWQHVAFYAEPLYLAAAQHALPLPPVVNVLQDIDPNQLLLLADGHCLTEQTIGLCGLKTHPGLLHAQQLDTLMQLTAQGQGVAVLPALAAGMAQQRQLALQLRPIINPLTQQPEQRPMVLVTRQTHVNGMAWCHQLVNQLVPLLQQAMALN